MKRFIDCDVNEQIRIIYILVKTVMDDIKNNGDPETKPIYFQDNLRTITSYCLLGFYPLMMCFLDLDEKIMQMYSECVLNEIIENEWVSENHVGNLKDGYINTIYNYLAEFYSYYVSLYPNGKRSEPVRMDNDTKLKLIEKFLEMSGQTTLSFLAKFDIMSSMHSIIIGFGKLFGMN